MPSSLAACVAATLTGVAGTALLYAQHASKPDAADPTPRERVAEQWRGMIERAIQWEMRSGERAPKAFGLYLSGPEQVILIDAYELTIGADGSRDIGRDLQLRAWSGLSNAEGTVAAFNRDVPPMALIDEGGVINHHDGTLVLARVFRGGQIVEYILEPGVGVYFGDQDTIVEQLVALGATLKCRCMCDDWDNTDFVATIDCLVAQHVCGDKPGCRSEPCPCHVLHGVSCGLAGHPDIEPGSLTNCQQYIEL